MICLKGRRVSRLVLGSQLCGTRKPVGIIVHLVEMQGYETGDRRLLAALAGRRLRPLFELSVALLMSASQEGTFLGNKGGTCHRRIQTIPVTLDDRLFAAFSSCVAPGVALADAVTGRRDRVRRTLQVQDCGGDRGRSGGQSEFSECCPAANTGARITAVRVICQNHYLAY